MKTRILRLEEAFELASILSKYVDVERLSPDADALDFISDMVDKITPQEYLRCVAIMTKNTEEDIQKIEYSEILASFISGLQRNRVVSLLSFYKSMGS